MAKGRDVGPVEAGLIIEVGDRGRFSPGNVVVRFRFILNGGGS